MAPSFFSKFAKATNSPNNHERLSSESQPKSTTGGISAFSIGRNRSHSATINNGNGSNGKLETNTSRRNSQGQSGIPSIVTTSVHGNGSRIDSRQSFDTLASEHSTQPNFTIVPPSPLVRNNELDSDSEEEQEHYNSSAVASEDQRAIGTNRQSTTNNRFTQEEENEELPTPTPTPTVEKTPSTSSSPPLSARTTASISTIMPAANGGLAPGPYQLKKQTSNKSINKKTAPSELQINTHPSHLRSATSPPETTTKDVKGVLSPREDSLVESPTELNMPSNQIPDPISAPNSPPRVSPSTLAIQRENTTASILSLGGDGKSSKLPWQRSNTRKPTGLASAIAASGLAMANPSLTAAQVAQATATMSPPATSSSSRSMTHLTFNGSAPGSPPYLTKSPTQSSVSQKSKHTKAKSADLSPRSTKSRKSNGKSPHRRSRRPSTAASAKSDAVSDYSTMGTNMNGTSVNGDDALKPDYYSNLELDDTTDSGEDDSGSDFSQDDFGDGDGMDIPVTGFAVASNKRNADFHEMFPTVPEGDYLIEDYGCAMQREILIQGRLYISENHICFHANIFGWITDLSLPIYEITALEKKMTAFVIPNAIQITTRQAKYTFTSFLSRDTTFDVIYNIWKLARPEDGVSVLSSGRGSLDGPTSVNAVGPGGIGTAPANGKVVPVKKTTTCACGREGKHYPETAMEVVVPGTPEKIYNLMFASGFMKDFMHENQKLLDIQMSDWSPLSPGSNLLTRNMTYIKPLSGSLGPKQTKCEIKDETEHMDFDDYVSTVTTTRTPDVPSGGVFSVKTRTCLMWATPMTTKVVVTTQVEWTGRSFIKGIIERSAIEGQRSYHGDLEKAMRSYIQAHQTEFLPEGVEAAAVVAAEEAAAIDEAAAANDEKQPTSEASKQRERERNARGLQWAWDTVDGAYQVAKNSTKGALELIRDAWDQSSSTTILWFVIVILVLSNIWTMLRMGSSKAEAVKKLEERKQDEQEKWVQSIVTALWDEMGHANKASSSLVQGATSIASVDPTSIATSILDAIVLPSPTAQVPLTIPSSIESLKAEVKTLHDTLNTLEERVKAIRTTLSGLEKLDTLD